MVRILTANAKAQIRRQYATEPISIVDVSWISGSVIRYADKDIPGIAGKILSLSNLDDVVKIDRQNSSTSAITVVLDDTDGSIKALMDRIDIHKRPCTIYQYYDGMDLADAFVVYAGEIVTPIVWKEGTDNETGRTVTFDVMTQIVGNEVGFTPEEGQFPNIPLDLLGQTWPLGFGDCVHVPGVKVNEIISSATTGYLVVPDPSLKLKSDILQDRMIILQNSFNYFYNKMVQIIASNADHTPDSIIFNYTTIIEQEDTSRQNLEDATAGTQGMREQIDALKDLKAEAVTDDDATAVQGKIDDLIGELNSKVEEIQAANEALYTALYDKQVIEIDAENAEYVFQVVSEIRTQLSTILNDYQNYFNQYTLIQQTIKSQKDLRTNTIGVVNATKLHFPQGQEVEVFIGGIKAKGVFSGDQFTLNEVEPKYTDVGIGARQDNNDNYSAFWIDDPTKSLKGCYCLLANGFIFQVTDQAGTQCIMTPIPRKYIDQPYSVNGPQIIPFSSDLDPSTYTLLGNAKEYTTSEKERMIQDAIQQSPESGQLEELKQRVQDLISLSSDAPTQEEYIGIQNAIMGSVSLYNDIIQRINVPQSVIDSANAIISQHEFDILFRMQTLQQAQLVRDNTPIIPDPNIHNNNLNNPKQYILSGIDIKDSIKEVSEVILPHWIPTTIPNLSDYMTVRNLPDKPISYLPSSPMFIARPGATISLAANYQEKFIANIIPSTVFTVYAFQSLGVKKVLTPVPKSYYTVNGNDPYGPVNTTTVSLVRPLSEYNAGWDDQIYISYRSSVGPNTVDIIQWLLQKYATANVLSDSVFGPYVTEGLSIDAASFAAVRGKIGNFPSSFCLFDRRNVLDLVQDIAWQARCAVFIKNRVAYMQYLAEIPAPIATFDESNVEENSLEMSLTPTEDIVTKLVASWQQDYAYDKKVKSIVRYNINKYGTIEEDYDFFIYNTLEMVRKAATFWLIRKANSFKKVSFTTFMTNVDLETFDAVNLHFQNNFFSNGPVTCLIDSVQYNSESNSLDVTCWMPVRAGEMTQYSYVWPSNLPIQTIYPTILEMTGGYAGNIVNSLIPTGSEFSLDLDGQTSVADQIQFRPKDYGEIFISDAAFSSPTSPLDGLATGDTVDVGSRAVTSEFEMPLDTRRQALDSGTYTGSSGSSDEVKGGSPNNSPATTQVKELDRAGGDAPNFSTIGRIIEQLTVDPDNPDQEVKNLYTVELLDGRQVPCRQVQISPKSVIPNDTMTPVFFNSIINEYQMQVPVWLDDTQPVTPPTPDVKTPNVTKVDIGDE